MVDRLRQILNRPIADGDRQRLFLIVVAILAGAALILALVDDTGPEPAAPERPERPAPAAFRVPAATPSAPSEEGNPPASLQGSRRDIARSKQAARRFLARYLPYTYGRGRADRIPAATPELRAALSRARPRGPARSLRRRPRLELLQSNGVSRERAKLVALVRDGRLRYTVRLRLANTAAGWLVTELGR
jgi:hypothetical protein